MNGRLDEAKKKNDKKKEDRSERFTWKEGDIKKIDPKKNKQK